MFSIIGKLKKQLLKYEKMEKQINREKTLCWLPLYKRVKKHIEYVFKIRAVLKWRHANLDLDIQKCCSCTKGLDSASNKLTWIAKKIEISQLITFPLKLQIENSKRRNAKTTFSWFFNSKIFLNFKIRTLLPRRRGGLERERWA